MRKISLQTILIALLWVLNTPSHASTTDYDGDWSIAINCMASGNRGPWGFTSSIKVTNGSRNFDIPLHRGGPGKATIEVSGQSVTIRANASNISWGMWPGEWQLRLRGALTSDNRFQANGAEYFNGGLIRNCGVIGNLFNASADSIAGKREAAQAAAKASAPISAPTPATAPATRQSPPPVRSASAPTSQPPTPAGAPQRPSDGLSREQVRAIQGALAKAGFYDGAIDGIAGPRTRAGIEAWQRARGHQPTGQLNQAQLEEIQQPVSTVVAAPTAPVAQTPTPKPAQSPTEQAASTSESKPAEEPAQTSPSETAQATNEEPAPVAPTASEPTAGQRVAAEQESLKQKFTSRVGPLTANYLFIGDEGDILLFTNEDPEAPHFIRRVTGQGVFRDNKMNVCAIGNLRQIEPVFSRFATNELEKLTTDIVIQNLPPWTTSCNTLVNNSTDDVISILRGDLIKDTALQDQIVTAFANKRIRWFDVINRKPFDSMLEQQAEDGRMLRAQLRKGELRGYGLLASESDDPIVCAPLSEDAEFVKRAVADIDQAILTGKEPGPNATIIREDLDDVFLRTKRGECGFIFGDGATLSLLASAFERDGFAVDLLPVVLPEAAGEAMMASIRSERAQMAARLAAAQAEQARLAEQERQEEAQRQAAALREAEQRRAALEQQARLEEIRRSNEEAARREKLEQIRRIVASRARAIQDTLDDRIRLHLDSVAKEVSDTKLRAQLGQVLSAQEQRLLNTQNELQRLAREFPDWSNETVRQAKEEWSFGDISVKLEDYGQAKWRGRDIEAISVRVEFPMTNALIGERRTGCEVFTWINDEEFKFWRQTMSTDCDFYDDLFEAWAIANQFSSQWKLPPN